MKKPDIKIISNSSPVVQDLSSGLSKGFSKGLSRDFSKGFSSGLSSGLSTQINYSTFYHNSRTSTPLLNSCKSCGYGFGNLIKCPGGRLVVKCGNCILKKIKLLISQHRLTETLELLEESGFTGDLALLFVLGEIAAVGCGDE